MIKQGILNFFKNLKYVFTPLGTLFLGMLFGVCFLTSGFKTQVNYATTEIQTITSEANISIDSLKNCVLDSFADISWDKPTEAIKTITSSDWLNNTLKANLEKEIENYATYASEIEGAVQSAIKGYVKYIVAFILCSLLGLMLGIFLTKFLIRREIAKRNILKYFLVSLIDSIITIGLAILCSWLGFSWKPSILISGVLAIIIYGMISLFEAYIVHGYKKVSSKEIVNIKNIFSLFASDLIIFLIALVFSAIIYLITNVLVAIFIILPLLVVATIVI